MRPLASKALGPAVGVLLAFLAASTVVGSPGETLEGSVQFSAATLGGETNLTSPWLGALHMISDGAVPLKGSWSLEAAQAELNWSRVVVTGAGNSPTDPDRSLITMGSPRAYWGQRSYAEVHLSSQIGALNANLLLVPGPGRPVAVEVGTYSNMQAQAATGQTWLAGAPSNHTPELAEYSKRLSHAYVTVSGQPLLRGKLAMAGTVRGDFTLHVWGSDVTVRVANDTHSYRSGAWWTNATGPGPRGAVREEHWQLLRIKVDGGTLQLDHKNGIAQWTGPSAYVRTNGTAVFEQARGSFWSPTHRYDADGQTVKVDGNLKQWLSANPSFPGRLVSEIEAFQAQVDLEPSAAVPKSRTDSDGVLWWGMGLGALGAVAAICFFAVRRIQATRDGPAMLSLAETAMAERRFRDALRLTKALLRGHPAQPDAWFVHSASRIELGDAAWVVRELTPRMKALGSPSSLAYLLTIAHVHQGNRALAKRWFEVVRRDPNLLNDFLNSPRLAEVRARLGLVWGPSADTGYA